MNFAFPLSAIYTATEHSAVNSSAFYFTDAEPWDWISPQNDALWRDGVKTLFDPCPAGWRVPKCGEGERSPWRYFENGTGFYDNGQWNTVTPGGNWNATVVKGASSVWYPACGWRHFVSGDQGNVLIEFALWSSSEGGFMRGRAELVNANFYSGRAHGFPVRYSRTQRTGIPLAG